MAVSSVKVVIIPAIIYFNYEQITLKPKLWVLYREKLSYLIYNALMPQPIKNATFKIMGEYTF